MIIDKDYSYIILAVLFSGPLEIMCGSGKEMFALW